ncbi:MAG TPA: nuclear transport factor 2 family protein [Candidatus Angelobacter sp.]|nr:nuclear transport factor 2 family protein [Candidatus Angelobacter sp.]
MATQLTETAQVLDHHLQALGHGNLDEILDDYLEDSVLITPDGTIKGLNGIRAAFQGFLSGLFKPGTYALTFDARHVNGEVAYIVWHAKCASADIALGTDTFMVKDGKILVQTFAAKVVPR